tara:strand:+ start:556 stop:678 length:123 start_codon:yes stop_codon:yes gene_type:complete
MGEMGAKQGDCDDIKQGIPDMRKPVDDHLVHVVNAAVVAR